MSVLSIMALVLAGVGLYMALSFLVVYLLGEAPDYYKHFAAACLVIAAYVLTSAALYGCIDPEVVRWVQKVQIALSLTALPLMVAFARRFTGNRSRAGRWGLGLLWAAAAAAVLAIPTDLVVTRTPNPKTIGLFGVEQIVPESATGPLADALAPIILAGMIWLAWMMIDATRRKVPGTWPFLIGVLVLVGAGINDGLVALDIAGRVYLLEIGFLTMSLGGSASMALESRRRERELLATHHDLCQLSGVEEKLARSERLALVGQMLSGVAHELNNPLTAVAGIAEGLSVEGVPASVAARVDIMRQEALRAGNLVRHLLDIARMEQVEHGPVSLVDIVARVMQQRRGEQEAAGIETQLTLDSATPMVAGDPDQLEQVVLNLVINAEQALTGGGRIHVRTSCQDDQVSLTVQDDGSGIPEELLPRIFDPFFTTRQKTKGTGLGLFLCATRVEQHHGSLSARNMPEGGARFTLRLPLTTERPTVGDDSIPIDVESLLWGRPSPATGGQPVVPGRRSAAPGLLGQAPGGPLAGIRVAIVDDEEGVVTTVQAALELAGAVVAAARDAAEAQDLLRNDRWDVVLCDINMPDLDGRALMAIIRRDDPQLASRFVLMTGDVFETAGDGAAQQPAVPVLHKPFRASELLQAVQRVLLTPRGP